jgi:flagellar biosynthesis/type III secretory pathway M-ring protein FliF/YscJ
MLKGKKFLIISVLILLVILIAVYFYSKSVKQEVQPAGLTEEERIKILNELNSGDIKPVSETEREKILKDLGSGSANTPLTEAERTAILNSLNNPQ